ncbi:APC family permease [Fervidicoccus fontis]|uniref:APC family permease n=1 Tax=Fervidicoccus fontis TaxID=683846 RepID=A0A7C2Z3A1_9CREN|nr:APC family permease [Fervidicoccus fontis]PMB76404.1 MAG: amino acid transporter [Fervidicoccus fontis]HEW64337.1 APC family permease [Fervidicoccus fontis]
MDNPSNNSSSEKTQTEKSSQPKLKKVLTFTDIFLVSLTGMIGSAWLFSALGALNYMGPAAILSWIVAAILFVFMIVTFAELGGLFPYSGGIARYNHYTHGPISNFFLSWAYLISSITTSPVEAVAIVEYSSAWLKWAWNPEKNVLTPEGMGLAVLLIIFFFIIQYIGVSTYQWFNRIITALKFVIPVLTIILIFTMYFDGRNFMGLPGGFFPFGAASILTGSIISGVVFAYEGFEEGLMYAGEAKNPQRDVPLGIITALFVVAAIYILLQVAYIGGINWSAARVSPGDWTGLYNAWGSSPFYYELVSTGVPLLVGFAVIIAIDAILSPAGTFAAYVGSTARQIFAMAKIGYLPEIFGSIHKKYRTPWVALIFSTIIAIIFLMPFPTWYSIMSVSVSAAVYSYMTGGITAHALKKLVPDLKRPYKTPFWQLFYPAAFVVASLFVYWSGWSVINIIIEVLLIGLPLLFLGPYGKKLSVSRSFIYTISLFVWIATGSAIGLYYYVLDGMGIQGFIIYWSLVSLIQIITLSLIWLKTKSPDIKASSWLIIYNIVIGIVSYIGSLGALSSPLLPVPYDIIVMIIVSLLVYYIGLKVAYKTEDLEKIEKTGIVPEE